MRPIGRWPAVATVLVAAAALTGCASAGPDTARPTDGSSMTAEAADTEQLDLLDTLMAAVPGAWGSATVHRSRTCTAASGTGGVQITRRVRGDGITDGRAAARAFRDVLTENGFDVKLESDTPTVPAAPSG